MTLPPTTTSAAVAAFSSPSKNIGCYVDSVGARCDINSSSFAVPQQPASCQLAWGHGLSVSGSDRGTFVCASDTTLGPATILQYGASTAVAQFECTSEESGMTCRNTVTNHGFTLSKTTAHVF